MVSNQYCISNPLEPGAFSNLFQLYSLAWLDMVCPLETPPFLIFNAYFLSITIMTSFTSEEIQQSAGAYAITCSPYEALQFYTRILINPHSPEEFLRAGGMGYEAPPSFHSS